MLQADILTLWPKRIGIVYAELFTTRRDSKHSNGARD